MRKGNKYKRMKYGDRKVCIVCDKMLPMKGHFRVVNVLTGYTSQTCLACEQLESLNPKKAYVNSSGYMYLVFDSVYPEYIKIGYTTNLGKRISRYNGNRPLDTCSYVYQSKLLVNILSVEADILQRINTYAHSTPNRNEWFSVNYKEKLIEEIKLAEDDIKNHPSIN